MKTEQAGKWIYDGVFYLASGLTYLAVFLRSVLIYQKSPYLIEVLGLLLVFLVLFLLVNFIPINIGKWFHIYLGVQTVLVFLLLNRPAHMNYDYFSILFGILGMHAMQHLNQRAAIGWIGIFFVLLVYRFIDAEGVLKGSITFLLFGSVIIFLSAYALTTRQAQLANSHNQALMEQLKDANLQLETHSDTLRQFGIAHERQRLRRELHDSVTQTIFSMTLTTQSALLLLDRDPKQVGNQLDRLNQLAQGALIEMHTLISELRPNRQVTGDMETDLRQHIAGRQFPEALSVSIEVERGQPLPIKEEQGLFRITQEALNNVVKHSQATQACIRLHFSDPVWIEIEDNGQGFQPDQTFGSGQLGLAGMRERAAEINWTLIIQSSPGAGTTIRVEKSPTEGRA
jgi:signal transduction histidine kinase